MSAAQSHADDEAPPLEDACPGAGKCHGCMVWCDACGDTSEVCDTRLRLERCDQHPIPRGAHLIQRDIDDAKTRIRQLNGQVREAERDLDTLLDEIRRRWILTKQLAAEERRIMGGAT